MQKALELPPLQKRIVLELAKKGPQTKNEISKHLEVDRSAIYTALESLQKKDIAYETSLKKEYRGQSFSLYWLTVEGVIFAIVNHINIDLLREYAVSVWEESEPLSFIFDLAKNLPNKKRIGEFFILFKAYQKGKLWPKMLKIKSMPITTEEMKAFMKAALKYPTYKKVLKQTRSKMDEFFDELEK